MNADRPLPFKPEAERAILGAVLADEKGLRVAEEHLCAADFFIPAHRRIFAEMRRLAQHGQRVELVTLCDVLRHDSEVTSVGGAAFVASLCDGMPKHAPIETWAKSVRGAALLRQVAFGAESLIESALNPSAQAEEIAVQVQALGKAFASRLESAGHQLVAAPVEELLAREIKRREMLIDPILPEQGLALLYAYRGIGKTFLALGIAGRLRAAHDSCAGLPRVRGGYST
jgi:replicative DNA helicase